MRKKRDKSEDPERTRASESGDEEASEDSLAGEAESRRSSEDRHGPGDDPGRDPDSGTGTAENEAAGGVATGTEVEAAAEEELVRELEELRDRHLRLAAEFDNYRKRTREELLKTRELAQADLIRRLLDALDDLGRIAETPAESTTVETLHEGVALVERKLKKELADAGLEPIQAKGQIFDPAWHEALAAVPTDDPDEDDLVARVFVPGYRFEDRLVRPARVEVKKYSEEAGAATGQGVSGDDGEVGDQS